MISTEGQRQRATICYGRSGQFTSTLHIVNHDKIKATATKRFRSKHAFLEVYTPAPYLKKPIASFSMTRRTRVPITALSQHSLLRKRSVLLSTLLPIIAKPLLHPIPLLLPIRVLCVFTSHDPLLTLAPLNRKLGAELDRAGAALGQLVKLRVRRDGRDGFLRILAGRGGTCPRQFVGDLRKRIQLE
jgi:hypothetical protein